MKNLFKAEGRFYIQISDITTKDYLIHKQTLIINYETLLFETVIALFNLMNSNMRFYIIENFV